MKTTDTKHAEGGSDILSRIIRKMMDPTWFMEQRRGFDRIRFDARMSAALRDGDETDLFTRYLVARALDPTLTDQDMIDLLVGADDDSDSGDDGGPDAGLTPGIHATGRQAVQRSEDSVDAIMLVYGRKLRQQAEEQRRELQGREDVCRLLKAAADELEDTWAAEISAELE